MKKEKPTTPPSYLVVPGTQYIILPDDKVARLLTPTHTPAGDTWAIRIGGKTRFKIKTDTVRGWATGEIQMPASSESND